MGKTPERVAEEVPRGTEAVVVAEMDLRTSTKREAEEQLQPDDTGGAASRSGQSVAMDVEQLAQMLEEEKNFGQSSEEKQVRLSSGHEWTPRSLVTQGDIK